ncbi:MAG TPA: hypothetical protein VFY31_00570 [Macromonas sp.]|nr:hypothetical protein [Macromonas sp.]
MVSQDINPTVLKCCAWSGVVSIVLMALGFAVMAGFVPPPSPMDSALDTARQFVEHKNGIRFGMIVSMVASAFLMPFAVVITLQMRRIEGPAPALAYTQLGLGAILVLEFIYLLFFWQVATFRVDRAPELIQLLNDMAWVPFVGLSSTLIMQSAVFGIAILMDRRAVPVFPRWLGYFNLWSATMFTPGSFNVFFMDGFMAWDGMLAFYIPVAIFVVWMLLNSWYLAQAVNQQVREQDGRVMASPDALAQEVALLREQVNALLRRLG